MKEHLPKVCVMFAVVFLGLSFWSIWFLIPFLFFCFLAGSTGLARGSEN